MNDRLGEDPSPALLPRSPTPRGQGRDLDFIPLPGEWAGILTSIVRLSEARLYTEA